MFQKQYQTRRLRLLCSDVSLAGRVTAFYGRNRANFQPTEPLRSEEFFTEAFQRKALARDAKNAQQVRALRLWLVPRQQPQEGDIIGLCGLGGISFGNFCSAFLYYKLDAGHTGQGYMSEAVRRLIDIAFNGLKLHRLEANVMPRNAASLQLAKQLGFQEEGLAKAYLNIAGVWEDHLHLVLLNDKGGL